MLDGTQLGGVTGRRKRSRFSVSSAGSHGTTHNERPREGLDSLCSGDYVLNRTRAILNLWRKNRFLPRHYSVL